MVIGVINRDSFNGGDLDAKLKKLDSDIDNANQLAGP